MGNNCCNPLKTSAEDRSNDLAGVEQTENSLDAVPPASLAASRPGEDEVPRYVSQEEFVEQLVRTSSTSQEHAKQAMINLEHIETILMESQEPENAQPLRRASDRKGTGYITKDDLEAATQKISFREPSDGGMPPIAPAPNRKGRKPTGMVTKEQLLEVLKAQADDEDEEEEDGVGLSPSTAAATEANTGTKELSVEVAPVPKRKGRKPTGYVPKSKLRQVLQVFGDKD
mmetsp:Transcript_107186/g.268700  ORF Transcript_107186/g.268700 Transcript_107186/m.268700 type:complete len:229 (+) Transcript_107186:203-889(+)